MIQMSELDYLRNAVHVVRDAATIATDRFGKSVVVREKEFHDVVTDADLAVEERIVKSLSQLYPTHGFYAEEQGNRDTQSEYVWVVDPIDGSKYYSRGVPP